MLGSSRAGRPRGGAGHVAHHAILEKANNLELLRPIQGISPAGAAQLTSPLADLGNAGLFYLCATCSFEQVTKIMRNCRGLPNSDGPLIAIATRRADRSSRGYDPLPAAVA